MVATCPRPGILVWHILSSLVPISLIAYKPLCVATYRSVGTYKAMGGGWIEIAKESADETDFPPPPEENSVDKNSAG